MSSTDIAMLGDLPAMRPHEKKGKRKGDAKKLLAHQTMKRQWYRKYLAKSQLYAQKEGTCCTPYELGDCTPGGKHRVSSKSFKARMDCLEQVESMSLDFPAAYQGH